MTDTRLPDRWLLNRDLDSLSDGAWRVYTRALMYCNQQETDGQIGDLHVRYVYPFGDATPFLAELEAIGRLERSEMGWIIPDWEAQGQSTALQMAGYRENARKRQQTFRQKTKPPREEPVTRDLTGDVGEARLKARQGEARTEEVSWNVTEIPNTNQKQDKEI